MISHGKRFWWWLRFRLTNNNFGNGNLHSRIIWIGVDLNDGNQYKGYNRIFSGGTKVVLQTHELKIKRLRCLFTTYEYENSSLNILFFLLRNANGLTAFFITFDTLCKFWSSVCWEGHQQSQLTWHALLTRFNRIWCLVIGCIRMLSLPPTV